MREAWCVLGGLIWMTGPGERGDWAPGCL